ncbi:tRNA lysidine(34) synthetase TilS [Flavobacterium sp.]|uniref:tRNA lysidine(34) synthetase TilS n=1 Tax=Flavobacterium sp. TaxID=239 RepID=UPI003D0DE82D
MFQNLINHINHHLPFLKDKKLLLAISGGIDSMVLLHLFSKMNREIAVAHCNFQLRGAESDGDEEFVKIQCEKLKIKSFIQQFETEKFAQENKLSIQQSARSLRYHWFEEIQTKEGFDYLLTAHHLDDSLETFLINFTRGTGIEGLTGIPQINGKIVRPLLIFSREEIKKYAEENNIDWREDSSNASDKYFRNKIRHQVVPILKELNPSLLNSFQNTVHNLQQTQQIAQKEIDTQWTAVSTIDGENCYLALDKIKSLAQYPAYLYAWLQPYGFTAWEDIADLVEAQSGKQILSAHYRLIKDRTHLILSPINKKSEEEYVIVETDFQIDFPIKLTFCNQSYISTPTSTSIFVDKEKLKFPLQLRKWKEGDYFYPSGMQGKKKVSKFFKDEKFSLVEKENTWLLCADNEIIWIVNHRADQRFLATSKTKNIININLLK